MIDRIVLALALTFAASVASAASTKEVLATFLDDQVAAVCRIRLDRIDLERLGASLGDAADLEASAARWVEALRKAGARELYLIATLDDLPPGPSSTPAALVPLEEGADAQAIGALLCGGPSTGGPRAWTTCASIRGAVLAGDDAALERARGMKPVARPELAAAIESTGDAAVAAAIAPPAGLRRVADELTPTFPTELGGGPTATITRGLEWVAVVGDFAPTPSLRIIAQAADAGSAAAMKDLIERTVTLVRSSTAVAAFVPQIDRLAGELHARLDGRRVLVELSGPAGVQWARALIEPVAETSHRTECVQNLKQLGLAMHNYLSEHGTFPPAYTVGAGGKPLLSWRVLLLPYLDEAGLYKEFHLDEPWDSPHNKALVERMPDVLRCPSRRGKSAPGTTTYKTPRGPETIFSGPGGVTLKDVSDGTSNTIMVLETSADQAVVWTRPDDWDVPKTIDPKVVLDRHIGGASAVMADGSVRFLRSSINPETLRALLTRAGGEVVGHVD